MKTKGFTLTELLVAIIISAISTLIISSLFINEAMARRQLDQRLTFLRGARFSFAYMNNDFRLGNPPFSVTDRGAPGSPQRDPNYPDHAIQITDSNRTVIYALNDSDPDNQTLVRAVPNGAEMVITENVISLEGIINGDCVDITLEIGEDENTITIWTKIRGTG